MPVVNHVRLAATADSAANAAGRVHLKIAALAYVNACHGPGSDPSLAMAGIVTLCVVATTYYAAVVGRPFDHEDVALRTGELSPGPGASSRDAHIAVARAELRLAALTYASSRHGSDACMEFTRATIGVLCGAAIRYAEALAGVDVQSSRAPKVGDRLLQLED